MDHDQLHPRSHLFTVRLWAEEVDNKQIEWRGRVQHVASGEAHYFRDWPTLIAHFLKILPPIENQAEVPGTRGQSQPEDNELAPF